MPVLLAEDGRADAGRPAEPGRRSFFQRGMTFELFDGATREVSLNTGGALNGAFGAFPANEWVHVAVVLDCKSGSQPGYGSISIYWNGGLKLFRSFLRAFFVGLVSSDEAHGG